MVSNPKPQTHQQSTSIIWSCFQLSALAIYKVWAAAALLVMVGRFFLLF